MKKLLSKQIKKKTVPSTTLLLLPKPKKKNHQFYSSQTVVRVKKVKLCFHLIDTVKDEMRVNVFSAQNISLIMTFNHILHLSAIKIAIMFVGKRKRVIFLAFVYSRRPS